MSEVKRSELEILDMAIFLAEEKATLRCELDKTLKSTVACACCEEETKLKKNDIEGLKRIYENRLYNQREELRAEKNKAIREAELNEQIKANNKSIELLRWLYKEVDNEQGQ